MVNTEGRRENSTIVLLGTGTPNADPHRSGPSTAIIVDGEPYLVDFGPGLVRRAAAAFQSGAAGMDVHRLCRAFVTHLHSDHTVGYADLIFTPWVLGRNTPLEVYGPNGIGEMTEHILAAYGQDIAERIGGLEPATPDGYRVEVTEIEAGEVYRDSRVRVEAFPVRHGSWSAFGYKFFAPDRIIVVSGDTAPAESLVEAAAGCDVLIHEVYSADQHSLLPKAWQRYHSSVHTSSRELAQIAKRVKPGILILYHQLFWGCTEEQLVAEIRSEYDGKVVSGKDLEVY